jgi:four helix bundle protein
MEKGITNKITSFTQLTAWQKNHSLVLGIYAATEKFSKTEQFVLTSQIRRAVISITSNLAEGFSRYTRADKAHFYQMALGSTTEIQNQLIVSRDLHFMSSEIFKPLADLSIEVNKLINGLIKSLRVVK